MKRSEVIILLETVIIGYCDVTDFVAKPTAERILDLLERSVQMSPPPYHTRLPNGLEVAMMAWEDES